MASIDALRPNVNREEAVRQFQPPGWRGFLRTRLQGRLRRVALVYIPFRLYRAEIRNGARRQSVLLGLDAVSGTLDLYWFDSFPGERLAAHLDARNHAPALLPEEKARQVLIARLRRMVFHAGFFRLRHLHISAEPLLPLMHVPYWVGFRGEQEPVRIAVMDAVRRRMEGSKVRHLLLQWLED